MKKEVIWLLPKRVQGMFFVRKMQWMTENPDHNAGQDTTRIPFKSVFSCYFLGLFPFAMNSFALCKATSMCGQM